jgi:hypothetical protein
VKKFIALAITFTLASLSAWSAGAPSVKWSYTIAADTNSTSTDYLAGSFAGDGRGGCAFTWASDFSTFNFVWLNARGEIIASGELPQGTGGGGLEIVSVTPTVLTLHHIQYDNSLDVLIPTLNAKVTVRRGSKRAVEKLLPLNKAVRSAAARESDRYGSFVLEAMKDANQHQNGTTIRRFFKH